MRVILINTNNDRLKSNIVFDLVLPLLPYMHLKKSEFLFKKSLEDVFLKMGTRIRRLDEHNLIIYLDSNEFSNDLLMKSIWHFYENKEKYSSLVLIKQIEVYEIKKSASI